LSLALRLDDAEIYVADHKLDIAVEQAVGESKLLGYG